MIPCTICRASCSTHDFEESNTNTASSMFIFLKKKNQFGFSHSVYWLLLLSRATTRFCDNSICQYQVQSQTESHVELRGGGLHVFRSSLVTSEHSSTMTTACPWKSGFSPAWLYSTHCQNLPCSVTVWALSKRAQHKFDFLVNLKHIIIVALL